MLASVSSLSDWQGKKRKGSVLVWLTSVERDTRRGTNREPQNFLIALLKIYPKSLLAVGLEWSEYGWAGSQSPPASILAPGNQQNFLISVSNEPRLDRDMSAQPGFCLPQPVRRCLYCHFSSNLAQHSGPSNHVWNLEDYQVFCSICHLRPYMESSGELIRITKCPDCSGARRQRLEPRSRQAITSYFSVVTYWCQY